MLSRKSDTGQALESAGGTYDGSIFDMEFYRFSQCRAHKDSESAFQVRKLPCARLLILQ